MEQALTIICLLVVAVLSASAIFHHAFHDTLFQRVALAGFCLGALAIAWGIYQSGQVDDRVAWCSWFAALYGLETARKL